MPPSPQVLWMFSLITGECIIYRKTRFICILLLLFQVDHNEINSPSPTTRLLRVPLLGLVFTGITNLHKACWCHGVLEHG